MEVKYGYRSGDPMRPAPGEPRPEYDPDRTTLTARREAKAVELAALRPQEAKLLLGVARVGVRTLERWEQPAQEVRDGRLRRSPVASGERGPSERR